MSENKFTPGPWMPGLFRERGADPRFDGVDVSADDGINVCIVLYRREDYTNSAECKANASLIASAPCLLEALEQLVTDWQDVPDSSDTDAQSVFERARAAIHKARGKV